MSSIYHCKMEADVAAVLEQLRQKIATIAGVTLIGNRLTIRWTMNGQLVDVHTIIENVTTPEEHRKAMAAAKIEQQVWGKHPDEAAELFYIETGEYPQ